MVKGSLFLWPNDHNVYYNGLYTFLCKYCRRGMKKSEADLRVTVQYQIWRWGYLGSFIPRAGPRGVHAPPSTSRSSRAGFSFKSPSCLLHKTLLKHSLPSNTSRSNNEKNPKHPNTFLRHSSGCCWTDLQSNYMHVLSNLPARVHNPVTTTTELVTINVFLKIPIKNHFLTILCVCVCVCVL